MITVQGVYNSAICFCTALDQNAAAQIQDVCDQEAFAGSKIRIMPDVHAGMGCTIGTTMTICDKVVPGMVGVDIGCGMETVRLAEKRIDFARLDQVIRATIPSGREIRHVPHALHREIDLTQLRCASQVNLERARKSIGTLGGGNHFIEVDQGEQGELYLVVHSGSRHLGTEVAKYYQNEGYRVLCAKERGRHKEHRTMPVSKNLAYVEGTLCAEYLHDMKLIQQFAVLNRKAMVDCILTGMELTQEESFTTIHNYIDTEAMILRKGAVSAKAGEKLLIPINMRDGSLICRGRGNPDWNCSAPHGAGRLMSRKDARQTLSMEEYQEAMRHIYTTCVVPDTLDESPMAYKNMEDIIGQIGPTAEIIAHIHPIYNFKASE